MATNPSNPKLSEEGEWEIYMDTVEIKGSNVPGLRSILDMDNSKLENFGGQCRFVRDASTRIAKVLPNNFWI